jgi:hypothetical protein
MQDETAKINERPFRGGAPLAVLWRTMKMFFELVFDFTANGLDLRRAESRADHEIVREGSDAAEVEDGYPGSFFVLRRFDCQTDALWERV